MCTNNTTIRNDDDLYFVITNTILGIEKVSFTVNDIVKELKDKGIGDVEIAKGQRLRKSVEICIQNLIEHGKIIEEPRTYQLAEK